MEFKTGDRVICENVAGKPSEKMVYCYTKKNGIHVCQTEEDWEDGDFADTAWSHIRPAPKVEVRRKSVVKIMETLYSDGYRADNVGNFGHPTKATFLEVMWIDDCPENGWAWSQEWLEEAEVE